MGFVLHWPPNFFQQELMSQHLPGMMDERCQKLVFKWRQLHFFTFRVYSSICEVDIQIVRIESGLVRTVPLSRCVADRDANSGQQFGGSERLDEIVVGAGVESRDFLFFLITCR